MGAEQTVSAQQASDAIERMSMEDPMTVVEVLERRLLEQRRSIIAQHATTTLQAIREGRARYGSVEDIKQDLDSWESVRMMKHTGRKVQ